MTDVTLPSAWPMALLALVVLAWVAWLLSGTRRAQRRRGRLATQPFPAAWRQVLRQRVPAVARLPAHLQQALKRHIQVFIAEKPFIGCLGLEITDEHRVVIAAQACMLLLGHEQSDYYPRLHRVLVYPDTFVVQQEQALGAGLVQVQRRAMSGQSWSQGQVILSWSDVLAGAADPADGQNVVLHEFAHQVDQDKGIANGRPWRASPRARRRWAEVMDAAFARLQAQPSNVIDAYAATDPAELFAVVTELFFERPQALADEAPAVYAELAALYRLQPLGW